MYANANANNMEIVPKTTVTRIKNASNHVPFVYRIIVLLHLLNSQHLFFEGCIATTIINNTHTTTISDKTNCTKDSLLN